MTFTELVTRVTDRLNLASATATTRIGTEVNQKYKEITSSVGLNLSRRGSVSATIVAGTNEIFFTGIEQIETVINLSEIPTHRILNEISYEELVNLNPEQRTGKNPKAWAKKSVNALGFLVAVDQLAGAGGYTLQASGLLISTDLSGSMKPQFPDSYHWVIAEGVLLDEYMKMEKEALARIASSRYEKGLSDLRMFLAKSAYLDIHANKKSNYYGNTIYNKYLEK